MRKPPARPLTRAPTRCLTRRSSAEPSKDGNMDAAEPEKRSLKEFMVGTYDMKYLW